jgi:hypothetical protein
MSQKVSRLIGEESWVASSAPAIPDAATRAANSKPRMSTSWEAFSGLRG